MLHRSATSTPGGKPFSYDRTHDIRAPLARDKPTVGTWLQLPSTDVAELMARAGYDWVAVDMEHGSGRTGLPDIFRAIECGGAAPFPVCLKLLKARSSPRWRAGAPT